MDRRRPVGLAEILGIDEAQARRVALADDDQRAMPSGAAQALKIPGIDRARGQLGDRDVSAETADDAGCAGRRRVEHRHGVDPRAADLQIGFHWVEPIERKLLDCHLGAERAGLARQPVGAGGVARSPRAVGALRVPGLQPSGGALFGVCHCRASFRDG
jgi:hypothetical protein